MKGVGSSRNASILVTSKVPCYYTFSDRVEPSGGEASFHDL